MIYFIIGTGATIFAYLAVHLKRTKRIRVGRKSVLYPNKLCLFLSFLVLFIPAAIRYRIGTDYSYTYAPMFTWIRNGEYSLITGTLIRYNEVGFTWLNKIVAHFTGNVQWIFVITSFITLFLVYKSIKDQSVNIPLSVFMLILGSFYLASYNFVRQCLAIAIFSYSLKYIENKEPLKYFICIAIAITIHTIAIVYIPFYFLQKLKISKKIYFFLPVIAIVVLSAASPILIKLISLTRFARNIKLGQDYNIALSIVVIIVYYLGLLGYKNKGDTKYTLYLNILLVAACCLGASSYTGANDRLVYAFYYTNFLTLPYIIKKGDFGNCRIFILCGLILLLLCLWGFEHVYYDQFGVLPYQSVFSA